MASPSPAGVEPELSIWVPPHPFLTISNLFLVKTPATSVHLQPRCPQLDPSPCSVGATHLLLAPLRSCRQL